MKKKYEKPQVEVIKFDFTNIPTCSSECSHPGHHHGNGNAWGYDNGNHYGHEHGHNPHGRP